MIDMSDERKLKPVVATPQDDHVTGGGGGTLAATPEFAPDFAPGFAPEFAPPPDDHATIGEPIVKLDDHATDSPLS
ncbi:hypothetical protein ACH427_10700 [Streptomyces sp. NPDC020379]|uniref:hypothetical protein n=1 Tax=Streptomyces sp. NPDC020379 TaxID=3365071 RepID=UPI0037B4DF2A